MTTMKSYPSYQEPTHEEIALSAFLTWEKEGRQPGREMTYWLRAEAEIRAFRQKKAETTAVQTARRWPSQPATTRSKTVKSKAVPSAGVKATVSSGAKLATRVARETASKPTLPSRTVSVQRTAMKPAR